MVSATSYWYPNTSRHRAPFKSDSSTLFPYIGTLGPMYILLGTWTLRVCGGLTLGISLWFAALAAWCDRYGFPVGFCGFQVWGLG